MRSKFSQQLSQAVIRESQLKGEEGQEDLKESHRTAVTEVCDVIEKNILKVKKS